MPIHVHESVVAGTGSGNQPHTGNPTLITIEGIHGVAKAGSVGGVNSYIFNTVTLNVGAEPYLGFLYTCPCWHVEAGGNTDTGRSRSARAASGGDTGNLHALRLGSKTRTRNTRPIITNESSTAGIRACIVRRAIPCRCIVCYRVYLIENYQRTHLKIRQRTQCRSSASTICYLNRSCAF